MILSSQQFLLLVKTSFLCRAKLFPFLNFCFQSKPYKSGLLAEKLKAFILISLNPVVPGSIPEGRKPIPSSPSPNSKIKSSCDIVIPNPNTHYHSWWRQIIARDIWSKKQIWKMVLSTCADIQTTSTIQCVQIERVYWYRYKPCSISFLTPPLYFHSVCICNWFVLLFHFCIATNRSIRHSYYCATHQ